MKVGKRTWLSQIRKENNFNQEQLAATLGITKSYVSEIEQGNRTPSGYLALRYARTLGFKMERFFEEEPALAQRG